MTTRSVDDPTIDAAESALQSIVRVFSQGRVQDRILLAAGVNIGRADSTLLYNLHTIGDCVRLGDLADRLGVDAPTVTRRVQQLEARGLLRRSADPDDRRALRVYLTSEGTKAIRRVLAARRAWLEHILEPWGAVDRREFVRVLTRFAAAISAESEGSSGH